ncbi:unnamed protein product [Brassica rapa subsp. trilocularis]
MMDPILLPMIVIFSALAICISLYYVWVCCCSDQTPFLHNEQVEYSGTVLSTDWKEVGVKKI